MIARKRYQGTKTGGSSSRLMKPPALLAPIMHNLRQAKVPGAKEILSHLAANAK